jgi:hypothetical protein
MKLYLPPPGKWEGVNCSYGYYWGFKMDYFKKNRTIAYLFIKLGLFIVIGVSINMLKEGMELHKQGDPASLKSAKTEAAFGICGILFGAVMIINTTGKRDIENMYEQISESGVDYEDVKADLDAGKRYKNIIIGEKYAMAYSAGTIFIDGRDLAWVYPKIDDITMRYYFIIPLWKTKVYNIEMYTFSRKTVQITISQGKKKFDEIMRELIKIAPGVLYGESTEWTKMRRNNPEDFLYMARQNRIREESKLWAEKYMEKYGFTSDVDYTGRSKDYYN